MVDFRDFAGGDRRDFFRGAVGRWVEDLMAKTEQRLVQKRYMRPPGALAEIAFLAACTRCSACIEVCPPHALVRVSPDGGLAAGTPYIDPDRQPCTVCPDMPCAKACPTDALTLPPDGWAGYRLASLELVADRCVTFHGTPCGVCARACPVGEAALAMDEGGHPVIRAEGCVGCGICVRACITSPSSFNLLTSES
ncbi:MAG TPA: 4Fe-4S dicluster domain-containing protein [Gemmatimonadales bacterium]|nr:4Fe-4S dicluster domain-containing protein [Gemmatimonadales bacterium]